jgi:hypothetical protein
MGKEKVERRKSKKKFATKGCCVSSGPSEIELLWTPLLLPPIFLTRRTQEGENLSSKMILSVKWTGKI